MTATSAGLLAVVIACAALVARRVARHLHPPHRARAGARELAAHVWDLSGGDLGLRPPSGPRRRRRISIIGPW
jgi:hypothetical protein